MLDRDILDVLSDKEAVTEAEIAAEIEEAGKLQAELITATITLKETLTPVADTS